VSSHCYVIQAFLEEHESMTVTKRFIAGAVCPRCAAMDAIRMHRDEVREYRECVKCGFEDSLRLDGRPEPEEVETRVTRSTQPVETEQAQPIKFIMPSKRKDH